MARGEIERAVLEVGNVFLELLQVWEGGLLGDVHAELVIAVDRERQDPGLDQEALGALELDAERLGLGAFLQIELFEGAIDGRALHAERLDQRVGVALIANDGDGVDLLFELLGEPELDLEVVPALPRVGDAVAERLVGGDVRVRCGLGRKREIEVVELGGGSDVVFDLLNGLRVRRGGLEPHHDRGGEGSVQEEGPHQNVIPALTAMPKVGATESK